MKRYEAADIADKLMAEIDPEVLLAGMLGAIATYGGITPPLTRILEALSDKTVGSDIVDIITFNPYVAAYGAISGTGWVSWVDLLTGGKPPDDPTEAEKQRKRYALMAAGAMEGMMMMTLVKNEKMMGMIADLAGKLGSASIRAAGEAVPF